MNCQTPSDCGCCAGIAAETPALLINRPGLSAIAYRVGTYQTFRRSLQARLSDSRWPVLRGLRTHDDDDFTMALLDAWAMTGDIVSFYQERIVNESYLRTATERLSILEQSRLIGYQLGPGLAATTHVAFTMEEAPGDPTQSAQPTTLAAGIKIQSVPGPNEQPQTFETIESIEARPAWNALHAQLTETQVLSPDMTSIWLHGTTLTLSVGDTLLIISKADTFKGSLHRVIRIEPDSALGSTKVLLMAISTPPGTIDATESGVFVMRIIASPFGHNAPKEATYTPRGRFKGFHEWSLINEASTQLTLSSRQDRIFVGSWAVVGQASGARAWTFAKVDDVTHLSVAKYGMAGNVTQLKFDKDVWIIPEKMPKLDALREVTIVAQSEELALAKKTLLYPVYGQELPLDALFEGLSSGRPIAVSGKRQLIRIKHTNTESLLQLNSKHTTILAPGDTLRMVGIPLRQVNGGFQTLPPAEFGKILEETTGSLLRLPLMDRDGKTGILDIQSTGVELLPSADTDETLREIVFLEKNPVRAITDNRDRTTLRLATSLVHVYERMTVRINANVAAATHGESVKEPVGSGDAAVPYQHFTLRQPPVTYVGADTPDGSASTLKVYVNELLWEEVPFFYGHGPIERIYVTRRDDEGRTTIRFGDGITGARLPTGQNNVRAEYRKGTGFGALVRAGQLSLLMSRPLGLKGAVNPEAAQGAKDPESTDDARTNAPLTVLTLDRAVSLQDYEDFARTFSGVAKAQAVWVWDGRKRSIFLTVAGPGGEVLAEDGSVITKLQDALRAYGDPFVVFTVQRYRQAWFEIKGTVTIDSNHVRDVVMNAISADLQQRYTFAARSFGQPVARSEVIAAIQAVPGVVAVDLDHFARRGESSTLIQPRLIADRPGMGADKEVMAAELLLLDPASLTELKAIQ